MLFSDIIWICPRKLFSRRKSGQLLLLYQGESWFLKHLFCTALAVLRHKQVEVAQFYILGLNLFIFIFGIGLIRIFFRQDNEVGPQPRDDLNELRADSNKLFGVALDVALSTSKEHYRWLLAGVDISVHGFVNIDVPGEVFWQFLQHFVIFVDYAETIFLLNLHHTKYDLNLNISKKKSKQYNTKYFVE